MMMGKDCSDGKSCGLLATNVKNTLPGPRYEIVITSMLLPDNVKLLAYLITRQADIDGRQHKSGIHPGSADLVSQLTEHNLMRPPTVYKHSPAEYLLRPS